MIPFGIRSETMVPGGPRPAHRPVHVLSLGNDRHRDWPTLVAAAKGWDDCVLRLVFAGRRSGAGPMRADSGD